MRAARSLGAGAVALLILGGADVTMGQDTAPGRTVSLSVSPAVHGTTAHPKAVGLKFSTDDIEADGTTPPTIQEATIMFPKGLRFNGRKFPSCSSAILDGQGPAACPAGSKVGTGNVEANALGLAASPKITAFNGPGGNKIELFVSLDTPISIAETMEGVLSPGPDGFANQLRVQIPPNLQQPAPGVYAAITHLDVSVRAHRRVHGKAVSYIESTSCTAGGWPVRGVFTLLDNTVITANGLAPCS